jgi:hypothetical protein
MAACTKLSAADTGISYLLEASSIDNNDDSVIQVSEELIPQPTSNRTQIVELNYNQSILSATAAARATQFTGQSDEKELRIKEFVLASSFGNWEWSAGRRINSFGLGNAFRPLDLIQQQDLLTHEQESLTGVNQLALERYQNLDSYGVYLVNPDQLNTNNSRKRTALVARFATSRELMDWQTTLRYSEDNHLQAGFGGISILGDALSLHSSLLWSSRYQRPISGLTSEGSELLSATDPWIQQTYDNGLNWMLGANWTWSDKQNLVLEYWHNDFALSKQQWQEHLDLMQLQNRLLTTEAPAEAVEGNLAWSARAFANTNRMQNNLLARWSYSADTVQPRLTLLYSPDDSGLMTEATFTVDRYAIKFQAGARHFSGPDNSVYDQLIEKSRFFFSVYGNF